jgi:alpha-mannosidase
LKHIDTEASLKSEKPFALAFFPPGGGTRLKAGVTVSDSAVQVTAFKKAERGNGLIIRLFEPTGRSRSFRLTVPFASARTRVSLEPFEIKTLRLDVKKFKEVNLLER